MLGEIGAVLLILSLALAIYAAGAALWGIRRGDERWAQSARNATYALAALMGAAVVALLAALLGNQFQIRYVAQHSATWTPLYLKVSALWAGQEGSLLFWGFLQALLAALAIGRPMRQARLLVPWATVLLNLIAAFFIAVICFRSNPFALLPAAPPEGQGLNPLLRHPGMILHPPALYVGFVALSIPFAFALAALLTRRVADWPAVLRPWILLAWLSLGAGLLLGMRWAYDVLGWGGYWAWDPVENAGLLPWLTATALLHGAVMQRENRGFELWNLLLAVASFALTLFGTLITRSGLIESVHAFTDSGLGGSFLAALVVVVGGAAMLLVLRRDLLRIPAADGGLLSRQGAFFITLVLLATLSASILIGSVLPTLSDVLSGRRFVAGPDWFDRVTGPQWAALLLLMGVCPLLGRAATALRRDRIALAGGALATMLAGAALGLRQPVSLIGLALVGAAGGVTLVECVRRGWRRRSGGYLVHAGIVLMAVGIIGTRVYPFSQDVTLDLGAPMSVGAPTGAGEYTLIFEGLEREMRPDHLTFRAAVAVYRGQHHLATLRPRLDHYPHSGQRVTTPALRSGAREDLYLVLAGWNDDGSKVTITVMVNVLINFLWLGGLVLLAGGALAFWPSGRRGEDASK